MSADRRTTTRSAGEPMILFGVGEFVFAIPAVDVEEIRDEHDVTLDRATAVGLIKGKFTRARREYSVVDSCYHFRLLPSKSARLLVLRKSAFALTADSIDRMVEVDTVYQLPAAFHGEERKWYRGLSLIDGNVVPVVNTSIFAAVPAQKAGA